MERFLKALACVAVLSPAVALAGPGKATSAIDLYYVPQADGELSPPASPSDSTDGDGFGVRGLIRVGPVVLVTGEYQTVSYDGDAGGGDMDFDQIRLGVGATSKIGLGGYVEYVTAEVSDLFESDGFGIHGRFAGNPVPQLQLYGDVGYLMLDTEYDGTNFSEDMTGFEFTVGAAFAFTPVVGAFLDYRQTTVEGDDTDLEFEAADIRIGGRLMFGG